MGWALSVDSLGASRLYHRSIPHCFAGTSGGADRYFRWKLSPVVPAARRYFRWELFVSTVMFSCFLCFLAELVHLPSTSLPTLLL